MNTKKVVQLGLLIYIITSEAVKAARADEDKEAHVIASIMIASVYIFVLNYVGAFSEL